MHEHRPNLSSQVYRTIAQVFGFAAVAALAVYGLVLYYDLQVTASFDGQLPFTWNHFVAAFMRTVLNALVVAMLTGVTVSAIMSSMADYLAERGATRELGLLEHVDTTETGAPDDPR